tara:strand:- start:727 stop:1395 length:669 start_codon:yes stop_codon:yes gene_type:complete
MGLAKEIKLGTKKSHSAAENTGFIKNFLAGVVSEDSYKKLVADFYFVYRALEEQCDKYRDDPALAPILSESLKRTNSLERDLRHFYGPMWRNLVEPTESCQKYVNRIREVPAMLLVGHHYTRYLGDLSGGQILCDIASKALKLKDEGLRFYEFEQIPDAKKFKDEYRAALDGLPLNSDEKNLVIDEANYAFKLNMYMFDEIEGNAAGGFFKYILGRILPNRG